MPTTLSVDHLFFLLLSWPAPKWSCFSPPLSRKSVMRDALEMEDSKWGSAHSSTLVRVQRRRSPWARIWPPAHLGHCLHSCRVKASHPRAALKGHRALPSPRVPGFHPTFLPRGELTPAPCEMHQIPEVGAGRHLETCERVAQVHRSGSNPGEQRCPVC